MAVQNDFKHFFHGVIQKTALVEMWYSNQFC